MLYIDEFLKGNLAVNCQTREEAVEFFRRCRNEHGITWITDESLTDNNTQWHVEKDQTAYDFAVRGSIKGLQYCNAEYHRERGTNVVCYSELFFNQQDSDDFEPASDEEFNMFLAAVGYKEG